MRSSDWSSDVCSSDLGAADPRGGIHRAERRAEHPAGAEGGRPGVSARGRPNQDERTVPRSPGERGRPPRLYRALKRFHLRGISPVEFSLLDPFLWETVIQGLLFGGVRSEEHTSELQSLMRISYAVFCLKKKKTTTKTANIHLYKTHICQD